MAPPFLWLQSPHRKEEEKAASKSRTNTGFITKTPLRPSAAVRISMVFLVLLFAAKGQMNFSAMMEAALDYDLPGRNAMLVNESCVMN